jgi:hypothetical protein
MDSRADSDLPDFVSNEYYDSSQEYSLKDAPPYAALLQPGIDLVAEYYSYKYQMPALIKTWEIEEVIAKLKAADFLEIRNSSQPIRIPFLISGSHSAPVVYLKQEGKEYLLFFDSLGDMYNPIFSATAFPDFTIYTSESNVRQRDFYSCHTDAMVFLRELTGKDEKGNYLMPDLLEKLEQNKIEAGNDLEKNICVFKLFDDLLITVQAPRFMEGREEQSISHQTVRRHENLEKFLNKYPLDKMMSENKAPTFSRYLREKGLKFTHIIEIQFYVNALQERLGERFTKEIKDEFISSAKKIVKQYGKTDFISGSKRADRRSSLRHLAEEVLSKNLVVSHKL